VEITTSRFGRLNLDEDKLIFFKSGIPGFENLKKYALLPQGDSTVFYWLQSVEDPKVAFLVVNPFFFFFDYDIEIPEADMCELQLNDPTRALIFVIVTIPPEDFRQATVNLLAPIIVDTQHKRGKQIVLEGTQYTTRHPLFSVTGEKDQKRNKSDKSDKCEMSVEIKKIIGL